MCKAVEAVSGCDLATLKCHENDSYTALKSFNNVSKMSIEWGATFTESPFVGRWRE
jgi:hypothetical protein